MLTDFKSKIKRGEAFSDLKKKAADFWKENEREIILAAGVFLALVIVFGAGILVGQYRPKEPLTVENAEIEEMISSLREDSRLVKEPLPEIQKTIQKNFVASKNGKYYYPLDCAGVSKIKEENKIFFETKEQAEQTGLKPSPYCKW